MSLKVHALRGLVMERLTAAADEIFALFERTFAQYEEEVLGKLLQQPRVVLYKEDIQTVTVGEDIRSDQIIKEEEQINNEQEVDPPIKVQYPISADENRQDPSGEQCDGEEPGCSADGQTYSCSDEIQSLNVIVGVDVCSDQVIKEELMNVKQEVDPPSNLDCPSPTLKSEKSDPAKEQEREVANVTREQCDGEGLGCSANLSLDNNRRFYNSSDTDDSADWAEGTSKRNGEEPNASLKKKTCRKAYKYVQWCEQFLSQCSNEKCRYSFGPNPEMSQMLQVI
ncbi:uncharacterized protein LOC129456276 [Periophthalmus magnuspinnatus]|uniref:uncharacterized protein LOC129456276 n=1 Tax=Periophthalmus magnuspinnatus TaxID=409849 RepID=UPI0024369238|nr:uncharacterized protein LOC129456276 [Periophthalmus magnuspinnatus]